MRREMGRARSKVVREWGSDDEVGSIQDTQNKTQAAQAALHVEYGKGLLTVTMDSGEPGMAAPCSMASAFSSSSFRRRFSSSSSRFNLARISSLLSRTGVGVPFVAAGDAAADVGVETVATAGAGDEAARAGEAGATSPLEWACLAGVSGAGAAAAAATGSAGAAITGVTSAAGVGTDTSESWAE